MDQAVWSLLGNVNNVLGLGTFTFSLYAAIRLRQEMRRRLEQARGVPPIDLEGLIAQGEGLSSGRPIALAICLLPQTDSILEDVKRYLSVRGWEMDIHEIKRNGINGREDLKSFVEDMRQTRRELAAPDVDATEIHLFFAGPATAAALVASVLINWVPVKIYQYHFNAAGSEKYEYWMPLVR